jgi:copper chaperone CopZ
MTNGTRRGVLRRLAAATVICVTIAGQALAAGQTVVLEQAMTCPVSDPPLIEEILYQIAGVETVLVSYDDRTVTVQFEDTLTNPDAMHAALDEVFGPPEEAM